MSASSRTALTRELKPFEAPLLSTNDPQFLWPKYHILKYFGYANSFQTQKVFKPIVATGNVRDENINFESDKTSSRSKNKNKANLVIFKCFNQPSDT